MNLSQCGNKEHDARNGGNHKQQYGERKSRKSMNAAFGRGALRAANRYPIWGREGASAAFSDGHSANATRHATHIQGGSGLPGGGRPSEAHGQQARPPSRRRANAREPGKAVPADRQSPANTSCWQQDQSTNRI